MDATRLLAHSSTIVGVADPDAADPESSKKAAAAFNKLMDDQVAVQALLTEAEQRVDQRFTANVGDGHRGADFFAALRGEMDTIRTVAAADVLITQPEEQRLFHTTGSKALSASALRPRRFHFEKLCPCAPPLAPLSAMADRDSTARSASCLPALGVVVQSEGLVALRDLRSLASTCYTARTLVNTMLRSAELSVGAADASWENAAFVARLPGLVRLWVRGDPLLPSIDVAAVRLRPRMRLTSADGAATISEAGALFLGAIIGGGDHTLRLTDNMSYLRLADFRSSTARQLSLPRPLPGSAVGRAPDALAALGALARNEGAWHLEADLKTFKELVQGAQLTVCAAVAPDTRSLLSRSWPGRSLAARSRRTRALG